MEQHCVHQRNFLLGCKNDSEMRPGLLTEARSVTNHHNDRTPRIPQNTCKNLHVQSEGKPISPLWGAQWDFFFRYIAFLDRWVQYLFHGPMDRIAKINNHLLVTLWKNTQK